MKTQLAALAFGILFSHVAAADTGLVTIPTAYTLQDRAVDAHIHFGDDFHSYGGSYGLSKNLEIGVTFLVRLVVETSLSCRVLTLWVMRTGALTFWVPPFGATVPGKL